MTLTLTSVASPYFTMLNPPLGRWTFRMDRSIRKRLTRRSLSFSASIRSEHCSHSSSCIIFQSLLHLAIYKKKQHYNTDVKGCLNLIHLSELRVQLISPDAKFKSAHTQNKSEVFRYTQLQVYTNYMQLVSVISLKLIRQNICTSVYVYGFLKRNSDICS